jgi:hypothetical protein
VAEFVLAPDNVRMTRLAGRPAHPLWPNLAWEGLTKFSRRPALGVTLVAIALSGLMGAGTASATAAPVPRQAAASLHGEVNVTIWSIDSDGSEFQAVLSGAIGDFGPAVTVLPDGKVDPEHTSEIELELKEGTFRLYIDGIASKFRAKTGHEPVYAATCSDYVQVADNVPIVAGSGTGAYGGIRGTLSLVLTGNEVQNHPPCSSGFVRQILLLTGSGTVSS